MENETMEQCVDWLESMEKTDPERYQAFLATMQSEWQAAGFESTGVSSASQGTTTTDLFHRLTDAGNGQGREEIMQEFKPRFPGEKVMEEHGLKDVPTGMAIDVTPGFVIKTVDVQQQTKVFVNVVSADEIQAFSEKRKLCDNGTEQEGLHVPLSLGAPHEVQDKRGVTSVAFDVAVNPTVVQACKADTSGAFRRFVCEVAIDSIAQKYQVHLARRYKLPRLIYRGPLPPRKHYIRTQQEPLIQDITNDLTDKQSSPESTIEKIPQAPRVRKTATAHCTIYEERKDQRTRCERLASVLEGSTPLSPAVLQQAGERLLVRVQFETKVRTTSDLALELHAELVRVKATAHHDLDLFLPYPVQVDTPSVCLDLDRNTLELTLVVDKTWDPERPDSGSDPWLLAQAVDGSDHDSQRDENLASASVSGPEKPASLAELFHRFHSDASSADNKPVLKAARPWDRVRDDTELPEDRFHHKDLMSMHSLEQRRVEREQKAKEAEVKRMMHRRTEVEAKQKKAQEAGKSWHEMDPDEPETTYLDVDYIVRQEKARLEQQEQRKDEDDKDLDKECMTIEDARRRAAQWSEHTTQSTLTLQSALAFDLL